MMDSAIVQMAYGFALAAHEAMGQRRKYTNELYAKYHTYKVAEMRAACGVPFTTDDLVSAILHDILEDTTIAREVIRTLFGEEVLRQVIGLTDVAKPEDGNRSARVTINIAHYAQQCPRVKLIKMLDIKHNCIDIATNDPKYAPIYLREKKRVMIESRLYEGGQVIYDEVMAIINELIGED